MLISKKHVFWQAFFVTVLFFLIGIVLGVYIEQSRADSFNTQFYESESSLYDSFILGNIISDPSASCDTLKTMSIDFADGVYEQAKELEQFDEAGKLTDSIKIIHRKYDLLRTLLWMNIVSLKENCGDINTVVYLYIYDTEDINTKAYQTVWERILTDLKEEEGGNIILIPIATDQNVASLDYLIGKYGILEVPSVIINEEEVFYEHVTVEELKKYL